MCILRVYKGVKRLEGSPLLVVAEDDGDVDHDDDGERLFWRLLQIGYRLTKRTCGPISFPPFGAYC